MHSPEMESDVNITVWNQVGKKYMTEKLQKPTRKLLIPTKTGIFCLSRNGVNTGSTASFSSMTKKRRKNTNATTRVEITRTSSHYSNSENRKRKQIELTYRKLVVVTVTQKQQGAQNLG